MRSATPTKDAAHQADQQKSLEILHLQSTLKALTTKLKLSHTLEQERFQLQQELQSEKQRADDLHKRLQHLSDRHDSESQKMSTFIQIVTKENTELQAENLALKQLVDKSQSQASDVSSLQQLVTSLTTKLQAFEKLESLSDIYITRSQQAEAKLAKQTEQLARMTQEHKTQIN
jgi:hypothetical protein